jgi:hypothetical protein
MDHPSRYGCNSHVASDAVLQKLAEIGIQWHRIDFNWNEIEPGDGDHRWEEVDRVVSTCARLGLSVLGVVAYSPRWASGSDNIAAPPKDPGRFADFCREVVTRYPEGQVSALSVWNEPNLQQFWTGSKDEYLRMLPICLRAIRDVAPQIKRVGPDLSSSGKPLKDWLPQILQAAVGLFDVVAHHIYDGGDSVSGRLADIDKLRAFLVGNGHGQTLLWITETGLIARPAQQAEYLRGIYAGMRSRPWWAKCFWYDNEGAPGWGLLNADGTPKPAYFTYRDVIQEGT